MIPVGSRWALMWKAPHRIELEVIELTADAVVVESVHRCGFDCYLQQMKTTLPIEGRLTFRYHDFPKLFVRIPDGSIPLPA